MKQLILFIISVIILNSCVVVREPGPNIPCHPQKQHFKKPIPRHKHYWFKRHY